MKRQRSFESSKQHSPKGCPFSLYDAEDFFSYLEEKMQDARAVKLFQHVDGCEECQVLMHECDRQLSERQAAKRCEVLLEKTRGLWDNRE